MFLVAKASPGKWSNSFVFEGNTGPTPTYKFGDQWVLSDRTLVDVQYAHVGNNLQKAAREGTDHVNPVIHVFRSTGVLARRALLAFNGHRLPGFWIAWGYDVPASAVTALSMMGDRLIAVLPASTGADGD